MRNYKVTKSEHYSESKKELFYSYVFEYFNYKIGCGEWRPTRNINTKDMLKKIVLKNPDALGMIIQIA